MKQIKLKIAWGKWKDRDNPNYLYPWLGYETETPGLAVCRQPNPSQLMAGEVPDPVPDRWQIVHINSGMFIRWIDPYTTRKDALAAASRLGTLGDWTTPAEPDINGELITDAMYPGSIYQQIHDARRR